MKTERYSKNQIAKKKHVYFMFIREKKWEKTSLHHYICIKVFFFLVACYLKRSNKTLTPTEI